MTSTQFLLTFLVLISSFTLSPQRDGSKAQCVMIARARIKERLGRPVECRKAAENLECFDGKGAYVTVLFDESEIAKRIELAPISIPVTLSTKKSMNA